MPGPVIAGHAEAEDECGNCHDPLSDRPQFELCVSCHTAVGADLENSAGFHGRLPAAERLECASCHIEHEGRDIDIVDLDESAFDHALTDFVLSGQHSAAACDSCHVPGEAHREAATTCAGCHRLDDPHTGQLGETCDSCHNANDWADAAFDHSNTAFALTGAHSAVTCTGCHTETDFSNVGRSCVDCHAKQDVHKGRNGSQCVDCHSTESWTSLTFDHFALSGFALQGGHDGPGCQDCHRSEDHRDLAGSSCNSCHADDDAHEGRNGTDCAGCHTVFDWRKANFDHAQASDFVFPPGHAGLACESCHTNNVHDELPRNCAGCHAGDDVHSGQLGKNCESCHSGSSWTAQLWFDHDITSFPLLGSHAELGCDACHASAEFHNAETGCVACHGDDDPHQGGLGSQCDDCHNPADWTSWQFDHDLQTSFPLEGAHTDTACAACHTGSRSRLAETPDDCNSCHRRDDPHAGRFGNNCQNCHTSSGFSQIEGM